MVVTTADTIAQTGEGKNSWLEVSKDATGFALHNSKERLPASIALQPVRMNG